MNPVLDLRRFSRRGRKTQCQATCGCRNGEIKEKKSGKTETCLHEDGMTCQTRIGRIVMSGYMILYTRSAFQAKTRIWEKNTYEVSLPFSSHVGDGHNFIRNL